jgi:hypothetical protein
MAIDAKVRTLLPLCHKRSVGMSAGGRCAAIDLNGSCSMKCTKRSFAVLCIVLAKTMSWRKGCPVNLIEK